MNLKAKRRGGLFKRLALAGLIVAIFFMVLLPLVWPAVEGIYIRLCLWNAKSVELVHYNPYSTHIGRDLIYATKELQPSEFSKAAAAFPLCLNTDFSMGIKKCMFDPHHRILITSRFGYTTLIRVCFICDQVEVGKNGFRFETPTDWSDPLRKLFADEGMPFSPERYGEDFQNDLKAHPFR